MEEVKRRLRAIDEILAGSKTTSYKYTNVEFVGLQFRKIFELIILATLASHHHLFEELTRNLSKEWQISKIIAIVKRKNPAFYPVPIDRVPSTTAGIADDWRDVTTGFMTLDELITAHGTTANLMHVTNPYRDELAIDEFEKQFSIWRSRLVRLLDNHLVKFPDKNTILYVGMQNSSSGQVHTALFEQRSERRSG
jgi:hypothetical protein